MNAKVKIFIAIAVCAIIVFSYERISHELYLQSAEKLAAVLSSEERLSETAYNWNRFLPNLLLVSDDFLFFFLPYLSFFIVKIKQKLPILSGKAILASLIGGVLGRFFAGAKLLDTQTMQATVLSIIGFCLITTLFQIKMRER